MYIGKTPEAVGGVPLMTPMWFPSRTYLPPGYVPLDGQTVLRAIYPDAAAEVLAGRVPVVSEAAWATATNRGSYTVGDGSTTIRVPDFNGKSVGSLGALFVRGDGTNSAGTNGLIQTDALQGHFHEVRTSNTNNLLYNAATSGSNNVIVGGQSAADVYQAKSLISDGTNGTPRTAAETRPLNVTGCWAVKLFGAVTTQGVLDTQAMAAAVSALAIQREFVSAEQTISAAGSLTVAHGLGVRPKYVMLEAVCKTAEFGFSVNDVVQIQPGMHDASNQRGVAVVISGTTNIGVRFASGATPLSYPNFTTGNNQGLTNANWRLVIRAYA